MFIIKNMISLFLFFIYQESKCKKELKKQTWVGQGCMWWGLEKNMGTQVLGVMLPGLGLDQNQNAEKGDPVLKP